MMDSRSPLKNIALMLTAALGLAACAVASAGAPLAEPSRGPAAAPASAAAEGPLPAEVEEPIAAVASAEAQLNEALAQRGDAKVHTTEKEEAKPATVPPKAGRSAADDASPKKKDAEALRQGDACSTACSALASMERATVHLCGLTGETDRRCEDALARVEAATARVRASCPACAPP